MQKILIFDIETGPLPLAEIERFIEPFEPAKVKVGNIKDPEKIAEKIASAACAHVQDVLDNAALDALTGRVLCIGWMDPAGTFEHIGLTDEADTIRTFWKTVEPDRQGIAPTLIGFNSNNFDLPFLIRRSWHHQISVPTHIRRGRYWGDFIFDIADAWSMGDRMERFVSLNALARHLGVGDKTGKGEDFAQLWNTDKEAALGYLENDLRLTLKIAVRVGLIPPWATAGSK